MNLGYSTGGWPVNRKNQYLLYSGHAGNIFEIGVDQVELDMISGVLGQ